MPRDLCTWIRRTPNFRTVTVKMMRDGLRKPRDRGRIVCSGVSLHTVQVCGILKCVDEKFLYTEFQISDGTGTVACHIWPKSGTSCTEMRGSKVGAYYKVVAEVAAGKEDITLTTINVRRIFDHNEVTEHFLCVIREHLELLKFPYREPAWENKAITVPPIQYMDDIVSLLSLPAIKESVEGASFRWLASQVHVEQKKISEVLVYMVEQGSVYNTVDYEHFKLAID
ncbi:unnamed protein product [Urochloa decumbens]|uniref:OB domain-containing protein n=1 Tax=Urochloa decumbens TaxID=240449 RepID=A0ABC8X692_9POAL